MKDDFLFRRSSERRDFSNLLNCSTEDLDRLFEGHDPGIEKIQNGTIHYIFALVNGETGEALSVRNGEALQLATKHKATIHAVLGPLLILSFGTLNLPAASDPCGSRVQLVEQLRARLGQNIKIVHGCVHGAYGLFKNSSFASYSFSFEGFDAALALLGGMQFGEERLFPGN
ncbi:MAG: hypothetical protein AB1813_05515 [Verrucomicrobiota bacterium]